MYLIYLPEDGDEQRFRYQPRKLMSPEMEAIERATDRGYQAFTADVLQGNALCRRALLWVLLKRQHPTLRFADVSFAWDELKLEYSRQELAAMISSVQETLTGAELAGVVAGLEAQMADAIDEVDDLGKAQLPVAD